MALYYAREGELQLIYMSIGSNEGSNEYLNCTADSKNLIVVSE